MNDDDVKRDIELVSRLALCGASQSTIALALGVSGRELKERAEHNPELKEALDSCRVKGIRDVLSNLHRIASESDDVNAIKYYLGIQHKDYRIDKASVEITNDNRSITLPTIEEARRIIMSDPALLPDTPKE